MISMRTLRHLLAVLIYAPFLVAGRNCGSFFVPQTDSVIQPPLSTQTSLQTERVSLQLFEYFIIFTLIDCFLASSSAPHNFFRATKVRTYLLATDSKIRDSCPGHGHGHANELYYNGEAWKIMIPFLSSRRSTLR